MHIIDLSDKLEVQSMFSDPAVLTALRDGVMAEKVRIRRHMEEANGGANEEGKKRSDAKEWRRRYEYLRQLGEAMEGASLYVAATDTIPHL